MTNWHAVFCLILNFITFWDYCIFINSNLVSVRVPVLLNKTVYTSPTFYIDSILLQFTSYKLIFFKETILQSINAIGKKGWIAVKIIYKHYLTKI